MHVLKSGISAFYDSFAGLVPVTVLSVTAPDSPSLFDLGHGNARTSIHVECRVTENHGPYRKGEKLETNSVYVVPVSAVRVGKYSSRIGVYSVKPDKQKSQVKKAA